MGHLIYGAYGTPIEFDDRELAHLQAVIISKLRRGESFALSFHSRDGGRTVLWLNDAIPLQFVFSGSKMPTLSRQWLDALVLTSNEGAGLHLIPEPA